MRLHGLGCLALLLASAPVRGETPHRVAVLIMPTSDAETALADELSEIAIARMAEQPGRELVGLLEFRSRLGTDWRRATTCIHDPTCLGGVGVSLGAGTVLTGAVGKQGGHFALSLALVNVETGRTDARFFRETDSTVPALLRTLQEGLDDLLRPRPAPGRLRVKSDPAATRVLLDEAYLGLTPLDAQPIAAGPHHLRLEHNGYFPLAMDVNVSPGQEIQIAADSGKLRRRRTWAPAAAYGTGVAAVLCLGTGLVFGVIGQGEPSGATRADAQSDLKRREHYASAANGLLAGGAVLSLSSVVLILFNWRDIFGD